MTKKISKKNGEPFWIALVEDLEGSMEIFVNSELYEASKDCLVEEKLVFLRGFVRFRDTTASIGVQEIIPIEGASARLTTDLSVVIPVEDSTGAEERLFRLKGILQGHRGKCPVYVVLKGAGGEKTVIEVGREYAVAADQGLLDEVESLCGEDGYFVNRMRKGGGSPNGNGGAQGRNGHGGRKNRRTFEE